MDKIKRILEHILELSSFYTTVTANLNQFIIFRIMIIRWSFQLLGHQLSTRLPMKVTIYRLTLTTYTFWDMKSISELKGIFYHNILSGFCLNAELSKWLGA